MRPASLSSPLRFAMEAHFQSTLGFAQPGCIDMLLGADVFVDVLRHGWWTGHPGAFETEFGWVLCGSTGSAPPHYYVPYLSQVWRRHSPEIMGN